MTGFIFDLMETYDYENIFFCQEKTLGLKAIIVIHDTDSQRAKLVAARYNAHLARPEEIYALPVDMYCPLIAIAKEQHIPTYRAADVLAEQRIASVRQARSVAITSDWKI